jgi:exopolysaccharide biosynthesis protein
VENSDTGERASVELALFAMKSCTLRVIDQPSERRDYLAEVMRRERCLAGVNGGYFAPDYRPIGLRIADGKIIAPLQRAKLLSGIVTASQRGVQIMRVAEYSPKSKFFSAVECGPFLVDRGNRVTGLEATRPARRTFASIGSGDRAALGFCSDVTLAELGSILASGVGDFKIQRALNLDGGSSSAFWFRRKAGAPFSVSERKTVRDFVAVVPR